MKHTSGFVPALGFGWLTPAYDAVVHYTARERAFKTALLEEMGTLGDAVVLDLGCGTGTLGLMLKARHPSVRVTGLDADRSIVSIARRKARDARVEMHFDVGIANALPYKEDAFDKVVSSLFFHHLAPAEKRSALLEIKRVLRTGGRLYIADWSRPSNRLMRVLSTSIALLDGRRTTADSFEGKLSTYAIDAGFSDVRETAAFDTMFGTIRLLTAKN